MRPKNLTASEIREREAISAQELSAIEGRLLAPAAGYVVDVQLARVKSWLAAIDEGKISHHEYPIHADITGEVRTRIVDLLDVIGRARTDEARS
jgi:predicted transcriptional regulator